MSKIRWERTIELAMETIVRVCHEAYGDDAKELVDCYRRVVEGIKKEKGIPPAAAWLEAQMLQLSEGPRTESGPVSGTLSELEASDEHVIVDHPLKRAVDGNSNQRRDGTYYYHRGVEHYKAAFGEQIDREACARAIAEFSRAIELRPGFARAYEARAVMHGLRNEYELALKDYDELLRERPDHRLAHYNRAQCFVAMGRLEEAIEDLSQLVRLMPKDYEHRMERAEAHLRLGKTSEALEDLNVTLELAPYHETALSYRAQVYENMGKVSEARSDYTRILELGKNSLLSHATERLGALDKGIALQGQFRAQGPRLSFFWLPEKIGEGLSSDD